MLNLVELAKENNTTLEELQKIEENVRAKFVNAFKVISKEMAEKYVDAGIMEHINKFKDLKLDPFTGVILTFPQPKDGIAKKRKSCINAYITDPEAAIAAGVVSERKGDIVRSLMKDGTVKSINVKGAAISSNASHIADKQAYVTPLDNIVTWKSGKKNFNYLKPLPSEKYFCQISGLVLMENVWKPFTMTINEATEFMELPLNTCVKFYAKVIENKDTHFTLGHNGKHTKFEILNDFVVPDTLEMAIKEFYNDIELKDIAEAYTAKETNYEISSISGVVNKIWIKDPTEENPNPWSTIVLSDPTSTIKVLFPRNISLSSIDEGMFVKVWGSISQSEKWDSVLSQKIAGTVDHSMFGIGIYPFINIKVEIHDDSWQEEA